MRVTSYLMAAALCLASLPGHAGPESFSTGTLIKGYGEFAAVPDAPPIPAGTVFKVAFDVDAAASGGSVNRKINSLARFLNMHYAAGVPAANLKLALVVHGGAHRDLLNSAAYGDSNPNAELIGLLLAQGVSIELCGQTAAYYGVGAGDLLPGVGLSLSAMTRHAQLQQAGYTLNPF